MSIVTVLSVVAVTVLILALIVGWLLTLLGMPGNWLMVLSVLAYVLLAPNEPPVDLGWRMVVVAAVLATVGEIVELVAGAAGATKQGGSRRGALLALVGSLVGAVVGMVVGLPIPVLGPLLAALLFAGLGALLGAIVGEQWKGRSLEHSWQVGKAAFWGRLLGTLGKVVIGSIIGASVLVALIF